MGFKEVEDSDLDKWDVYIIRFYIRKEKDLIKL
jgi:hypothetical protein